MRQPRFYEQNETVRRAVNLLFKFPPDIRGIAARCLCAMAEAEFNAHVLIRDLKSLGPDKVLALYKSELRRREYDHDPFLRQAMNYLMILSPGDQFFLSTKLAELLGTIRDFMVLCKRHAVKLQLPMVEKLAITYVRYGLQEAEAFLDSAREQLQKLARNIVPQATETVAKSAATLEALATEFTGMRIRLNPDGT